MSLAVRVSDHCKSCHAEIVWCATTKGHRMPVDPDPVPDGNMIVDGTGVVAVGHSMQTLDRVIVIGKNDVPLGDPPRYVSHFQTCPDAVGWRRATR